MNLSEEKKTPLRDKDLNIKREMVIQYIGTASKTVSFKKYLLKFFYHLCFVAHIVQLYTDYTGSYNNWVYPTILVRAVSMR